MCKWTSGSVYSAYQAPRILYTEQVHEDISAASCMGMCKDAFPAACESIIDGILTDPSSLMALIAQNYHNVVYQIF
jgi:hypothetical protein